MDATPPRPQRTRTRTSPVQDVKDVKPQGNAPGKPKKPPPITPRRFTKFFAPRVADGQPGVRVSRSVFRDITGPAVNNAGMTARALKPYPSPRKRRKLSFSSATSSIQSSPLRQSNVPNSSQELHSLSNLRHNETAKTPEYEYVSEEDETEVEGSDDVERQIKRMKHEAMLRRRIAPYPQLRNPSASYLYARIHGRQLQQPENSHLWRTCARGFCSAPGDVHFPASGTPPRRSLPFCVTSCNTNTLIAIGQEDGAVRIVDSAVGDKAGFRSAYIAMKPHDNAIMDLAFSEDDILLASASGDQTAQVIDMQTQRSIHCLSDHTSSIKQVAFQPGSGNKILATCSRDGSINFWDLRSQIIDGPASRLRTTRIMPSDPMTDNMQWHHSTHGIRDAHSSQLRHLRHKDVTQPDRKFTSVVGRSKFSVTSLAFFDAPRSNLLVTASEIDAVVKLWDLRSASSSRRSMAQAISSTQEPLNHARHRSFGVTSVVLNTDNSLIYTLCRDHTIYAYSTAHLVSGASLDSSHHPSRPQPPSTDAHLTPLHSFRHPNLRVSTFYPRLSIRRPTHTSPNQSELLAVGSSNDCALIFPTNPKFQTKHTLNATRYPSPQTLLPTTARRKSSYGSQATHANDDQSNPPIHTTGTPLIMGHRKEVSALCWTTEGSLVTASDDFTVRCWREDESRARKLRDKGSQRDVSAMGWGFAGTPPTDDEDDF